MNDNQAIFDKINDLLEGIGLSQEINDTESLEEFIDNEENQQYEEYDEIENLYYTMMNLSLFEDDKTRDEMTQ
ncbi:MAG: hypothetical protein GXY17_06320 [Clostridiaceae bacterium]|jgi:hypothetical protein|nr:hypothetical protein [Clostridiaceae bacterium]